jgi:hypothetical protein
MNTPIFATARFTLCGTTGRTLGETGIRRRCTWLSWDDRPADLIRLGQHNTIPRW